MEFKINQIPNEMTLKEFKRIKGLCTHRCKYPISMGAQHEKIRNFIMGKRRGNSYLIDMEQFMFSDRVPFDDKMHVLLNYNSFDSAKQWYIRSLEILRDQMKDVCLATKQKFDALAVVGGVSGNPGEQKFYDESMLTLFETYYHLLANIRYLKFEFSTEMMFMDIYLLMENTINNHARADDSIICYFNSLNSNVEAGEYRGSWYYRSYTASSGKYKFPWAGNEIITTLNRLSPFFSERPLV